MGLLGILAWLGLGVGSAADSYSKAKYTKENKQKAIHSGRDIYYDAKNRGHYVETGELAGVRINERGERELVSYQSGRIIKNYAEEERKKEKEAGKLYYFRKFPERGGRYFPVEYATGKRFELAHFVHYNKKGEPIVEFSKFYYDEGCPGYNLNTRTCITYEEFKALGGHIPGKDFYFYLDYERRVGYEKAAQTKFTDIEDLEAWG